MSNILDPSTLNSYASKNQTSIFQNTIKPVLRGHSKIGFQYQLTLNAGQKYCRMLLLEHSAMFSTFIKLPFSIKTFVFDYFLSGHLRQVLLYLLIP